MALGATLKHIVIDVLGSGTTIALAGTVIGAVGGVLSARGLRTLLFGVEPSDPTVLLSVPILLLVVTLSACVVPALRAATVNPALGLRSD
jgi:ABC-type antimicrobial peptide transport system permease subunit